MPFIDEPSVTDLIGGHLTQVVRVEEQEARKLIQRMKRIRQDLRDRLDVLASDTFTSQQIRGVLVQVDAAIEAMARDLREGIKKGSERAALLGSQHLIREIERFDQEFAGAIIPLNIDILQIGQEMQNFLVNRHESSLKSYSEDLRAGLVQQLTDLSFQQVPMDTIIRKLSQFFIGEEWKLRRIARTELHHVYNLTKQRTLTEAVEDVPDLKKTLFHPIDQRTGEDSKAMAGIPSEKIDVVSGKQIVDVDKPFRIVLNRKNRDGTSRRIVREFMAPPDRPNDRSVLVPYRREWDD